MTRDGVHGTRHLKSFRTSFVDCAYIDGVLATTYHEVTSSHAIVFMCFVNSITDAPQGNVRALREDRMSSSANPVYDDEMEGTMLSLPYECLAVSVHLCVFVWLVLLDFFIIPVFFSRSGHPCVLWMPYNSDDFVLVINNVLALQLLDPERHLGYSSLHYITQYSDR